jgi:hypothetical protein
MYAFKALRRAFKALTNHKFVPTCRFRGFISTHDLAISKKIIEIGHMTAYCETCFFPNMCIMHENARIRACMRISQYGCGPECTWLCSAASSSFPLLLLLSLGPLFSEHYFHFYYSPVVMDLLLGLIFEFIGNGVLCSRAAGLVRI